MKKKIGILLALALVCYSTSLLYSISFGGIYRGARDTAGAAARRTRAAAEAAARRTRAAAEAAARRTRAAAEATARAARAAAQRVANCMAAGGLATRYAAAKVAEETAKGALYAAEGTLRGAQGALRGVRGTLQGARGALQGAQQGFNVAQKAALESKKAYDLAAKAEAMAAKIVRAGLGGPVKLKTFYTKTKWTPGMKITSETLVFAITFSVFGKNVTINTAKIMDFKKHPEKVALELAEQLLKKIGV